MDRRRFLQNAAVTTAALHYFPGFAAGAEREDVALKPDKTSVVGLSEGTPDIDGHTPNSKRPPPASTQAMPRIPASVKQS